MYQSKPLRATRSEEKTRRNSHRLKEFAKISCRRTLTSKQDRRRCEENVFLEICPLLRSIWNAFSWSSLRRFRSFFPQMSSKVTPSKIRRWGGYLPHVNKWKYWILTLNKIVATWRPFRTRMQKIPNSQMHCGPASYTVKGPLMNETILVAYFWILVRHSILLIMKF